MLLRWGPPYAPEIPVTDAVHRQAILAPSGNGKPT